MRALSTVALLEAWERGLGLSLCQRALTLLSAACPDTSPERLAALPIGQRDDQLLALRELTFGPHLTAVVRCLHCHAQLELAFNARETRAPSPTLVSDTAPPTFTVATDDGDVQYRLPTSLDLTALAGERNLARARALLLERCVIAITRNGSTISVSDAPDALLETVVQHMSRSDPQGDMQVSFTCLSCHQEREVAFDIASFFWKEIETWATRTLRDVHTLARAYGWSEGSILAMSAQRRQFYLDLVS